MTLNLAINLLKKLVYNEDDKVSCLSDHHLARIEQAQEQITQDLRRHYRVSWQIVFEHKIYLSSVFSGTRNFSGHI